MAEVWQGAGEAVLAVLKTDPSTRRGGSLNHKDEPCGEGGDEGEWAPSPTPHDHNSSYDKQFI